VEAYGYTAPGAIAAKRMRVYKPGYPNPYADLVMTLAYGTEGQLGSITYPTTTFGGTTVVHLWVRQSDAAEWNGGRQFHPAERFPA
jgi:hypothetical protein